MTGPEPARIETDVPAVAPKYRKRPYNLSGIWRVSRVTDPGEEFLDSTENCAVTRHPRRVE
jgi:hypothetical protein